MATSERRRRERADRHALILRTARELAEQEGWEAVTTRRLAERVEYSQPVLYSHFAGKDAIVTAIALEGFAELAIVLSTAQDHATAGASDTGASNAGASDAGASNAGASNAGASNAGASNAGASDTGARAVAEAYLDFARAHPAVYDAMFAEPTSLAFATEETPQPLLDGFAALLKVVGDETYAEVFWSALHGLASLERGRRLRRDQAAQRLDVLVEKMAPGTGPGAVVSG